MKTVEFTQKVKGFGRRLKRLNPFAFAKTHPNKAKLLAAIILLSGGGILYWWLIVPHDSTQATNQTLNDALNTVYEDGNYDEAIKQLHVAYDNASSKEGKLAAAKALGVAYQERKDSDKALHYFKLAESYAASEDVNLYLGLANAALAANDKETAKTNLQKAIDYYEKNTKDNPSYEQLVKVLQSKLDDLLQ